MPQSSRKLAGFLLGLLVSCSVLAADPVALNPNHPERYVVVKGDTLWDIAGHFLRDPWYWPEIWHVNPQIANPHLIYPGDVLVLTYVNGKPRLILERGSTVKLSPHMRSTPLDRAIPAIPMNAIRPFLTRPYVMERGELDSTPYVVDFADEHIIGGSGNHAYVRAIKISENLDFNLVRPGKPYKDGDTGEILGYEALYVGDARLRQTGDPATLELVRTEIETLVGDRLLPVSKNKPQQNFSPEAPSTDVNGSIIDVLHGVSQIGQYQVVVLDRGSNNGLQPGNVLAIDSRGEIVPDHVTTNPRDRVKLPDERAGTLMVFRTFPRVSFGLVMAATKAIHILDRVHNP